MNDLRHPKRRKIQLNCLQMPVAATVSANFISCCNNHVDTVQYTEFDRLETVIHNRISFKGR